MLGRDCAPGQIVIHYMLGEDHVRLNTQRAFALTAADDRSSKLFRVGADNVVSKSSPEMPSPPQLSRKRVFCLEESVWTPELGLTDETSVLPTLELLKRLGSLERFVHRHAVGVEDFRNYLSKRRRRPTQTFGVVYLAFHGSADGLWVGDEEPIDLDRLAEWLGPIRGGVVHFSSCAFLKNRDEGVRRFLKRTGARLISGYDRPVDWLDSIALETAYLGYLAHYERLGDALKFFRKRYDSLISELTWVAYP